MLYRTATKYSLRNEVWNRKLPDSKRQPLYQQIQALVDNDIANQKPPVDYNETNDPDGSLAKDQDERLEEFKDNQLYVLEAKEEYEKARLITLKAELKAGKEKSEHNAKIRKWE